MTRVLVPGLMGFAILVLPGYAVLILVALVMIARGGWRRRSLRRLPVEPMEDWFRGCAVPRPPRQLPVGDT